MLNTMPPAAPTGVSLELTAVLLIEPLNFILVNSMPPFTLRLVRPRLPVFSTVLLHAKAEVAAKRDEIASSEVFFIFIMVINFKTSAHFVKPFLKISKFFLNSIIVDKLRRPLNTYGIMQNFVFFNPTRLVFGKDSCSKISKLLPENAKKVLMLYGGGSIKKNGAYDQVMAALKGRKIVEFAGIEPNPEYETCMKAVKLIKKEKINFVLAVGGGSVIDGCKFICAAAKFKGEPWDILVKEAPVLDALPFGTVLTLPATGSEMNRAAVVSRRELGQKLAFFAEKVFPQFSVLDPLFTYTLPHTQTVNGAVDAFMHVLEQYLTYPAQAPLQDRFAEGIMQTLYEEAPKAIKNPSDYDVRANIMLCATMALNHLISSGVPQDWSTHMIGHEITALYGLDHAQTLAIVMPKIMKAKRADKKAKILQLGERVFGIKEKSSKLAIDKTIAAFEDWMTKKLGMKIQLADYNLPADAPEQIAKNVARFSPHLGERADITPEKIVKILKLK